MPERFHDIPGQVAHVHFGRHVYQQAAQRTKAFLRHAHAVLRVFSHLA